MCEWLRKYRQLIIYHNPALPQHIFDGMIIRESSFDFMVSLLEDSCSHSLTSEISRDGNGIGNAAAEEKKSMGYDLYDICLFIIICEKLVGLLVNL
jgi:hypothetical protein